MLRSKLSCLAALAAAGSLFASAAQVQAVEWGTVEGQFVLDGEIPKLDPKVRKGDATAKDAAKFHLSNDTLFVLGLAPRSEYAVEIDDQELEFLDTDASGTLQVPTPGSADVGVRVKLIK